MTSTLNTLYPANNDNFKAFLSKVFTLSNVKLASNKNIADINLPNFDFAKSIIYATNADIEKDLQSAQSTGHKNLAFSLIQSTTHKKADLINEQKLARIAGDFVIFRAICEKYDENLDDKALEKWVKSLNVLDELKLKVGAKVIFCVNNYDAGYYNGEQGEVVAVFEEDGKPYIEVEKSNGARVKLARYTFLLEDFGEDIEVRASLAQFPIKLAYAITIHKSQGMSIERLVCDIDNIFENGQLYVALSRTVEPKNLRIFYSRAGDFRAYFANALKFDASVVEFYAKMDFVNLKE